MNLSFVLDARRTIIEELQTTSLSTSGPSLDTAPTHLPGEQWRLVTYD